MKVTEVVGRAGVPYYGDLLDTIRHGEITSERDDRGYGWVDPDEVATRGVQPGRQAQRERAPGGSGCESA